MSEQVTDVDTSRPAGATNSTRYIANGGEESNKGITDWKAGATTEGDRQAQVNKHLSAIYSDGYIHNGVSVETFGRNLGVPAILAAGREIPVTTLEYVLGATSASPYGQELNNPNLAPEFKEMLRKMYPHKAPPEALPLPGNKITPYLSRGLGRRNLLKESFEKYQAGELSAEQFKGVADWAFKDNSILDAVAWEAGLQRGYDVILPSSPSYNVPFAAPEPLGKRVINAITGKLPKPGVKTSPWERIAPGVLSAVRDLIEQAGTPTVPNPKAREHYEAMKQILPKDVFTRIEKDHKDWSDDRKALEVEQILQNRIATRRAEGMSGIDAAAGTVGALTTALPSVAASMAITPIIGPYTAGVALIEQTGTALIKTLGGRLLLKKSSEAAAARTFLKGAEAVLKGTTALGRYPGAAIKGAAVMQDFGGGTKLAQELAHPTENEGNPYKFEPATAAMGAAFGVGGAALGHGWDVWTSKTTAAADIIADLQHEDITPLPPLTDPPPGGRVDPRNREAEYHEIHDLHVNPILERRPKTVEEASRLKELDKEAKTAQSFVKNPKQLEVNLKGWKDSLIRELDGGVSHSFLFGDDTLDAEGKKITLSLKEKLGVFKDASGNLPQDLKDALTKAHGQSSERPSGENEAAIEQLLKNAKTNLARTRAGHVVGQAEAIDKALTYLDTGGRVGPPIQVRKLWVEGKKDPDTGVPSKSIKEIVGITQAEKEAVQASIEYLKVHAPETGAALEDTLAHFQHLSGDLAKPKSEEILSNALRENPEVLTALDVPKGKIDLKRVVPEDLERAKAINKQLEDIERQLPIYNGRSRFKDNTETLRKPDVLAELNKDPAKGAAFTNNDVKDWHRKEMGKDFEPLEDIVYNTKTKQFEKNTEIPERSDEPDSTDNPPCPL